MYVFTLVKSLSHVDTVQTVLHGLSSWSDIYWSHTMKALGSLVTFVRRNSAWVVTLRYTYSDTKGWSRMFVVSVHLVSIQHMNWSAISWYMRKSNTLPVVYVTKVSGLSKTFLDTLRDVSLTWFAVTCNVFVTVLLSFVVSYLFLFMLADLALHRRSCCVHPILCLVPNVFLLLCKNTGRTLW